MVNQIWARYEQLDSGKFGAVGTLALNAEACELANLCSYELTMSETEPANAKGTPQACVLQALKSTFQI